jgi:hypothetical protein
MQRTKIPLNYVYDEIRHTDIDSNKLVDLTGYDYVFVVELHYPYTDMKYFNGLVQRMDELTTKGRKVALVILGDTLDTPRNGKLRGNYPLLTPKEVIEGFEQDVLFKIKPYLKVWILNNHDFEFMDIKDNPTDKVAYNIWKTLIPILRNDGVFITKRVVKTQLRGCKAVFEHEHLMPVTVNNRAWKYKNYQYRIFAGNHQAFMLENIYEDDYEPHKNIGVPPCVTSLFQYAEERMNPPLLARALEIDQTKKPIELRETS